MSTRFASAIAFTLLWALLCIVSGAVAANETKPAANNPQAHLKAVFDQAVQRRDVWISHISQNQQAIVPRWHRYSAASQKPAWSLREVCQINLSRSDTLETLARWLEHDKAPTDAPRITAYINAAAKQLNAKDPKRRAVACELFGLVPKLAVDHGLLPKLADHFDDNATAFHGFIKVRFQRTYQPVGRLAYPVTVAGVARAAITEATGLSFKSRAAFKTWWTGNHDYRTKLWYWSILSPFNLADGAYVDQAALAKLPPDDALRIALLAGNNEALAVEANQSVPNHTTLDWQQMRYTNYVFTDAEVADFIASHHLTGRMLDLLRGKGPAYMKTRLGDDAIYRAVQVLQARANPSLAPKIEAILKSPGKPLAKDISSSTRLASLAVQLDPNRAETILTDQIERGPRLLQLAADLVQRTGDAHWPLVFKSFKAGSPDGDGRLAIIAAVSRHVDKKDRKARLAELFAIDTLVADRSRGSDNARSDRVAAYAYAAAKLAGHPIVTDDLIARGVYQVGKGITPEMKKHNENVPAARNEAIKKLKTFFATPQP